MSSENKGLTENQKEALKLRFDWLKHLTTLISAIIVALVTVLRVFFTEYAGWELTTLLIVCFLMLFSGLGSAMITMLEISNQIAREMYIENKHYAFLLYYPGISAMIGLMAFAIYATLYEVSVL